jgi:hypothetical protein
MPNHIIITPKGLAIILLASTDKEAASFIIQIPKQLLAELQNIAFNFVIQHEAIAVGQCTASKSVDPATPTTSFLQGIKRFSSYFF